MTQLPEPCEFNSLELLKMAREDILSARQLMSYDDHVVDDMLQRADEALRQAAAQLEHCNGRATPLRYPADSGMWNDPDPWAWDEADTYGPSA